MNPEPSKHLRVTLVYEYDVNPVYYPNGNDPIDMAKCDIEGDPSVVLDAEWTIQQAEFTSDLAV
jgi:hypothetical protein